MAVQVQNPKEIKKKIEKIEKILEETEKEIDNVRVSDYNELKELDELLNTAIRLYRLVLRINEKIFNKYWSTKEAMTVGVAPTDISEDAERYVEDFIDFVENLKCYNVEQLYDYIRNHYIEEEKKGE